MERIASLERRRHLRVPITAHVTLFFGGGEPTLVIHGVIADISLGGIGLHLYEPIEVGADMKLEISFPFGGETKTETVEGTSIYSNRVESTHYVGIEFAQELNPEHQPYLCNRIQGILGSF